MGEKYARLDYREAFPTPCLAIRHDCSINAVNDSLDCIPCKEVVYVGLR